MIGRRPKLRERLQARDDKIQDVVRKGEQLQFADWADFFLENYSKPPIRAQRRPMKRTNEPGCISRRPSVNVRSARSRQTISSITFGGDVRFVFSSRPMPVSFKKMGSSRRPFIRNCGFFYVCRMSQFARSSLLATPRRCGISIPVKAKGLLRPHYMTWSEQQRIEF